MGNDHDNTLSMLFMTVFGFGLIWLHNKSEFLIEFLNKKETQALIAILVFSIIYLSSIYFFRWIDRRRDRLNLEGQVYEKKPNSSFCGFEKETRKPVYVTEAQRTMHTQVLGTTNAGKTESVILPWAIQDIQKGNGLIIIDGKSDRGLLNKLWSYTCKYGREKDFNLFSLGNLEESSQYNPLIGNTAEEVIERVFSAFEFDNSYYKNIQFEVFSNLIRLFFEAKEGLTFKRLHLALTDKNYLRSLSQKIESTELNQWSLEFLSLTPSDREQRISGLKASISHFSNGNTAALFNSTNPSIDIDRALKENKIIYFQLPVLLSPFLGTATGKMILQNIQNAVANRHRGMDRKPKFFSIFLDDFTEYLYPGFVSILNKSRSANVGIVFAHQALGDIKAIGDSIANSILTNSNLKIFMRGNDPESAEYFSRVIGTRKTTKLTERRTQAFFQDKNTGEKSAREVDEFIIHPNKFKNELGTGEAIMIIPLSTGAKAVDIKFEMFPDITTKKVIVGHKSYPSEIRNIPTEEKKTNVKPLLENMEQLCI